MDLKAGGSPEPVPDDVEAGAARLKDIVFDLADGGAVEAHRAGAPFWEALMADEIAPDRIMGVYGFTHDTPAWERHPAGEEILACLSGAIDIAMEQPGTTGGPVRTVRLTAGMVTVVPRDCWHRFIVKDPGDLLFVTYGKDTDHREVE